MNSKSFTLIELMTVVAIVAILSGITLIGFNLFLKQGKIAKSMAFDSSIHFNLGWAMVGDWKMNDNAANSTVVDTSGYNNDGTFYSGGSADNTANHSVDGANGTALEFDGVDDYIEVLDDDSLDLSNALTCSAWVKIKGNTGSAQELFLKTSAYFPAPFISSSYTTIRAGISDGAWKSTTWSVDVRTLEDQWHFFTTVFDGSTLKIYMDGDLKSSTNLSTTINISTSNLDIGARHGSDRFFNGSMDQVRIYSEAFSLSQVKYQYYTGLQRLYDKGLMSGKEYKSRIVKLNSES